MSPQSLIDKLEDKFTSGGGVDYLATFSFFTILEKFLSLAITLFTVYILVFMPIVMMLEIVYIAFPAFRDIEKKLEVKFKNVGYLQTIFNFTLGDAKEALEEANVLQTGKSPMLVYMRIKLWWVFLASCAVFAQIIGIKVVINTVLNLLSGILRIFHLI